MIGSIVRRYGLIYFGVYVGTTVLVIATALVLPFLQGKHLGFIMPMVSAMVVHTRFVSRERRLATRREYWALVAMSVVIALCLDLALNAFVIQTTTNLGLGPDIILLFVGLGLLQAGLISLFFYSDFMGRRYLAEAERKRRKQAS